MTLDKVTVPDNCVAVLPGFRLSPKSDLYTVQSKAKKPKKKPYPLIMHAFCHLDAQTKILRSNFSISSR